MKKKLSSSIAKACQEAEEMMVRRIGHVVSNAEDMIRYIVDAVDYDNTDGVMLGGVSMTGKCLPNYFFAKEKWREAREAMYYSQTLFKIYYEKIKYVSGISEEFDKFYLLFGDEAMRQRVSDNFKQRFTADPSQEFFIWNFYWIIRPFVADEDWAEKELRRAIARWKNPFKDPPKDWRIEQTKLLSKLTTWDRRLIAHFDAFSHAFLLQLCTGELESLDTELKPYVDWLKWKNEQTSSRINQRYYSLYYQPIALPEILIPTLANWMEARNASPENRGELAEKALKLFYSWYYKTDILDKNFLGLPDQILLSIVMRIELGFDLDTCREFARYFMPFLKIFPHIQDQLNALNVEYEPPSNLLPYDEVWRLRTECQIALDRDPDQ